MLATGLLCLMAIIYVTTLLVPTPSYAIRLVKAMSEAGIVGGLADWFAVTALFRHPLGLPIPHTAVIPASQTRIAATLGRFISTNFLTRDLILEKMQSLGLGSRLGKWLEQPDSRATLSNWVQQLLPRLVAELDNREVREFAAKALGEHLRSADVSGAVARLLRLAASTREADALFLQIADTASTWIATNKPRILSLVEQRNRWWIPKAVNRSIAEAIVNGFVEVLEDLRQPDSESRAQLMTALVQMAEDLVGSPERRAQLESFIENALSDADFKAWLQAIWKQLAQSALREAEQPSAATRQVVERLVGSVAAAFGRDPALIARVDAIAERLALVIVARRQEIARVVDEVVRGWDPLVMSQRLELVVGSDLQYIRMNGTLVGAVVGGLLFVVSHLLAPGA